MDTVYITGHKNPDTDSIVAAMAYAALRNALGDREYQAARLGHISDETQIVLDRFGFQAPKRIKDLYTQEFNWLFFAYPVAVGGLGYFIVSNVANIIAQIVAFFVNKEKTFNSGANVAVTLPIYIIFTIALIFFSAWLNPTLKEVFVGWGLEEVAAKNIATMICSAVQFFLYFPVDKILFHKKKEEKAE